MDLINLSCLQCNNNSHFHNYNSTFVVQKTWPCPLRFNDNTGIRDGLLLGCEAEGGRGGGLPTSEVSLTTLQLLSRFSTSYCVLGLCWCVWVLHVRLLQKFSGLCVAPAGSWCEATGPCWPDSPSLARTALVRAFSESHTLSVWQSRASLLLSWMSRILDWVLWTRGLCLRCLSVVCDLKKKKSKFNHLSSNNVTIFHD